MNPEQFAYWMHGFVELTKGQEPTAEQWKSIREHLETVFEKVTPPVGKSLPLDGQKSRVDWEKIWREMDKQTAPQYPQPHWPSIPPTQQPYWLQHGTVVCQSTPNIC